MRASSEKYRVILPSAADSEPLVGRRIGPAFSTRFQSIDRARGTLTQLLRIVGHLRRALARFKSATGRTRCGELGTHFLDLGGLLLELGCESLCLLSELGCESLYLFLLLRDHRFQLLNFAICMAWRGAALARRARYDVAVRYVAQVRYHPGSGQNPSQGGRRHGLE